MREAARHLKGGATLREYAVHVPDTADPAAVRGALGLSQAAFARRFGLDVTALQAWEQGRRLPDRTARILLAVIAREPNAVRRALAVGPAVRGSLARRTSDPRGRAKGAPPNRASA